MATVTVTCNKDARVAQSGGTNLGSGTSDGLPFGLYSGYRYRALLGFPLNFAGWTAINNAVLYIRNSNQIHVGFGSSPTICTRRINVAWSEGSSNGLSGSNAVVYPGPNATTINQVAGSGVGVAENTWKAINITAMMRDVLAGNPFYGLQIIAWDGSGESNSSADVGEIYSREAGSAAYIVFDYATNTPPNAPTIASTDVVGGLSGSVTPDLAITLTDPQADTLTEYTWQIDDNSDFSSPIQNPIVAGSFANGSVQHIIPAALTRGTTYYVRAQAKDASIYGAWSSTFSFKVASLPTVTVSEPSAAGRLGRISYDAGSGWASPRLRVDWDTVCPDGGSQQSYRVEIANDSAGSPGTSLYDSTTLVDASTRTVIVPATLTEGSYYHVRVTATCSHGLSQTVAYRRVRVRWGVITHQFNMGAPTGSLALTILDVTDETTGGAGRVVVEYMTGSTTAAPSTWSGTIGGAGLLQYLNYRTWLLAWGASPAVSPTLNEIKVTYTTAAILPDKWVLSDATNEGGDVAAYVYGTKSLRMKGKGSAHWATQVIPVAPNTLYMLSGRIQSVGNTGAYIGLATTAAGPDISGATTPAQVASVGFESPLSRVAFAVPWFSGSNTAIYVRCVMSGAVGTTAWFDALKVEASSVVTPWTPGYVANAVVLDAGGLQIDAFNGGIFRLRGSAGGVRDLVDLGANGLVFGGDTQLYSPLANVLATDGGIWSGKPQTPGQSGVLLNQGGTIEVVMQAGTPLIDLKADAAVDFDTRIWNPDRSTLELVAAVLKQVGLTRKGGTAFPVTGKTTGDTFYRTDLQMEFFWDGTRWLTTELFQQSFIANNAAAVAASGATFMGPVPVLTGMSDIWLEEWMIAFNVNSGGTALSASHKWQTDLFGRYGNTAGTNMSVGAGDTIQSGASDAWRRDIITINALVGALPYMWAWYYTKTGTPGALQAGSLLSYRYMAV